jgi:hypothetical protein
MGTQRLCGKFSLCSSLWGGQDQVTFSSAQPCLMFFPGLAVLRSPQPLALGRWHRVSAERLNKDGSLQVDGGRPVLRSSPGKSQGLNLHTLLYLGGVEPSVQLSPATNVSAHFRGCVGEVRSSPRGPVGGKGRVQTEPTCHSLGALGPYPSPLSLSFPHP